MKRLDHLNYLQIGIMFYAVKGQRFDVSHRTMNRVIGILASYTLPNRPCLLREGDVAAIWTSDGVSSCPGKLESGDISPDWNLNNRN
jgi:hypothetical protein